MADNEHIEVDIATLKLQVANMAETIARLDMGPDVRHMVDILRGRVEQARSQVKQALQEIHAIREDMLQYGQVMQQPTAEDIRTKLIVCPSNDISPVGATVDADPYTYWLQPHHEFQFRMLWQVEWDEGCFWEHVVWVTIQNGRIVAMDFTDATHDDCRLVIVCAVDCEGGVVGT